MHCANGKKGEAGDCAMLVRLLHHRRAGALREPNRL